MRIWLAKLGNYFVPVDEDAERVNKRMVDGECAYFRVMRVRDPVAHRRYWKLCELCARNCARIEIEPGAWMDVKTKEDVHAAVKLCSGHYTTIFDAENRPVARLPRSTSFDEMTADEWAAYWPLVVDAIHHKVLPGVHLAEAEHDILKCMRLAA